MAYEIVMPQLTDTMETGKIVRWLKKEGDYVEVNEPILEVESDKAIMEVPSLKSGYLTKILFDEGSEVPVGTVIAIISEKKEENIQTPEVKSKEEKKIETVKQEIKEIKIPQTIEIETKKLPPSTASPVAKVLAKEIGIDIKSLQEEGKLPIPAHEKDIKEYIVNQKLDENVINLLKDYQINPEDIIKLYTNIEKITVKEVLTYIKEKNIPLKKSVNSIRKSLIKNLKKSIEIPVFHIFTEVNFSNIPKDAGFTLTTWLVKILGDSIYKYEKLRTKTDEEYYYVYPTVNISIAVDVAGELFAPVIKNVEVKTLKDIAKELEIIKQKAKESRFSKEDLEGAIFSVSNLGMYNVISFDAIIPPECVGIVAVGKAVDNIAKLTFSFDHRIVNGKEAAEFINLFQEKLGNKDYINSLLM
ncbi:dihydrolipoamide acetyltransferase family protein [Sulfurihydrogenibium azorense]|jgi:pyruvate dehydrogenase E2 component (dihydrolipoamide acetyltransferase)|uniref:Dihydrolipoamide acetyltransferase component of pyruvate dehydrogenase complex n=1 Tax=Sulfurihydrogenibium azorense (strain DSM 15241 / OCM 825 / Az-Fu1) TaxID=204536 RepID=C1DWJ5_SULAA|nr:dihydrolipoamide acetyltransferase family protein [Sulfurihydrogenibium azorense]ACN99810.1 dihydrolipoyllysine-residue acetyltransferase component 2 of pyruvatedehydrogenase complex, (pyruvatedehydrogenase complex e2 subunit 2) (pdce2) (e2) (dihydrolipoamide s-acetyltransferase component 2 of pyruvate dehydrogenase complex) (pdc-e2) [Sulfurihydrogenibium azorense Az-Fu1]MDM7273295.1 dihydrolipoamide acetyltransferase family protein [Sulfurihydrogenibium azorense]